MFSLNGGAAIPSVAKRAETNDVNQRIPMSFAKGCNLLAGLALALSGGLILPCLIGLLSGRQSLFMQWTGLVVGMAVAAVAAFALAWPGQRNLKDAHRYFDRLSQIAMTEFSSEVIGARLVPLSKHHPLAEVAERLTTLVGDVSAEIQELEHARSAAEIRARRATEERDRIKSILCSLDEPILAIDRFDEVILANPSAESLLDFHVESAEHRALAQLVHCENLVNLLTTAARRKNAESCNDEIALDNATGDAAWYRVTASKLAAEAAGDAEDAAEPAGAVAVLRDIGQTKILQRRNADFVSSVSHEMKTPLAGIKAYVELLADGEAEDEATRGEFLRIIASQADRLQRLVENLLNLARMEAGVVKVEKKPRPLNEILDEALSIVRPAAEAKQITLVADLSRMYLGLLADRDMLLQAAINLLSNAIKYTHEGGRVILRSRMLDTNVCFEIEDTGVGLSEEDVKHVFEKFYRVKKDQGMASGTGLGLSLAKHVVEDVHGGTLTVRSVLGQGTTFTVTIPGSGQMS